MLIALVWMSAFVCDLEWIATVGQMPAWVTPTGRGPCLAPTSYGQCPAPETETFIRQRRKPFNALARTFKRKPDFIIRRVLFNNATSQAETTKWNGTHGIDTRRIDRVFDVQVTDAAPVD
ncbi:MAG: hypothetical protein ABI247_02615 [Rhodanobacter sp.]